MLLFVPLQVAGNAGPGLGEALEVRRSFTHVDSHLGRVNPVKPPLNPNNGGVFRFLVICVVTPHARKKARLCGLFYDCK